MCQCVVSACVWVPRKDKRIIGPCEDHYVVCCALPSGQYSGSLFNDHISVKPQTIIIIMSIRFHLHCIRSVAVRITIQHRFLWDFFFFFRFILISICQQWAAHLLIWLIQYIFVCAPMARGGVERICSGTAAVDPAFRLSVEQCERMAAFIE